MIERILLADTDVDLADVFASVTIRHGRGSADDGPLASTCSLVLVNVTRALSSAFSVGDELAVLLAADEPRFVGRITDAKLNDEGLSILAVSSLSWLSNRKIGNEPWPAELWSARVLRAFRAAGYETTWETWAGTTFGTIAAGRTWAAPIEAPLLTIDVGDTDPLLAARDPQETTLGAYLGSLIESEPAAIANLPNGNVLVQALTARKGFEAVELDAEAVAFAPEWSMVDDVENAVTVEWDGGEVLVESLGSIELYEPRPAKLTTELALEVDASSRADLRIARRATPAWLVESAELLELDAAISLGYPVSIPDLPDWAPVPSYVGMVEGWEDRIEPAEGDGLDWTMNLTLSAPRLSGYGLLWDAVPAIEVWADAGAATWGNPETILST